MHNDPFVSKLMAFSGKQDIKVAGELTEAVTEKQPLAPLQEKLLSKEGPQ